MTNRLLELARQHGTPIISANMATFVWQGDEPPALRGDWNNWEPAGWERVSASLWRHDAPLPADAYLEYYLGSDELHTPDPLNPRRTPNGLGQVNSYFYMPDARPTPLARRRRNVPHGTITRHRVDVDKFALGRQRDLFLYQPPTSQPSPLLLVFDGQDYFRRAKLPTIVDNLIAAGRMQPIALAMVANAGRLGRFVEYACNEGTLIFIRKQILPLAGRPLNLLDIGRRPGTFGVMGASMGGLMALYTGLRMPDLFGRVLSQSGAFDLWGHQPVTTDLLHGSGVKPLHVWMDVGRYEWLLESNRAMRALLKSRVFSLAYREYNGGHNYPAWRDDLWRGLEHLFPGRHKGAQ